GLQRYSRDELAAPPAPAGRIEAGEGIHVRKAQAKPALRREDKAVLTDPVVGGVQLLGLGCAGEGDAGRGQDLCVDLRLPGAGFEVQGRGGERALGLRDVAPVVADVEAERGEEL